MPQGRRSGDEATFHVTVRSRWPSVCLSRHVRAIHLILVPVWSAAAFAQSGPSPNEPINAKERLNWFAKSTVGVPSLTGGLFSAGFGTLTDRPKEYGTKWGGFGDRYGMRLTGVATSNAMEAGLGAIWGEDPRYYREGSNGSFGKRVGHIVKWTFVAGHADGSVRPAYARFAAISGNNFLSNTWRESSESNTTAAIERTGLGILARMAGNTFEEFWPDIKKKVFRRR